MATPTQPIKTASQPPAQPVAGSALQPQASPQESPQQPGKPIRDIQPPQESPQQPGKPVVRGFGAVAPRVAQPNYANTSLPIPRGELTALINRVNQMRVRTAKQRRKRARTHTKLSATAKGSSRYIKGTALTIAVIAEVLSIFSVGWLISWLIPIVSWYMVKQTNRINDAGNDIHSQREQLARQIKIAQQRLRPALTRSGQSALLNSSAPLPKRQFTSYIKTYIRDTTVTQLVELIPVVSAILPLYLVQVIKVIVQQRRIRKDVMETVPEYGKAVQLLDSLERFEVQYTETEVRAILTRTLQEASLPLAA